jgi:sterol 24-C-methyltransferase
MFTKKAKHDKLGDLIVDSSDDEASPFRSQQTKRSRSSKSLRRWGAAVRSFRVLKDLSPQQVDNFMNSYVIYSLDWNDEKTMTETLGPDYQKKIGECLRDYYSVLNHMCAIGELEKMYIPPVMDLRANIIKNQNLYEDSVANELELPPNPRLLDLGCGRGRVAAHMTRATGARVTGINIDYDQINSARAYNAQMKFQNEFIRMDFNDLPLPLPDNEFDGFYNVQAFSLCKDLPAMCRELFRVLKPGARLSLLDWAKLDAFDDNDLRHQDLMRKIKPLIGAVGTPTPESMAAAIESAGFRMIKHNNASIDGLQAPLIERADNYFRLARHGILGLVRVGLLPPHFKTILHRFAQDCEAFIEADRARLITTSYHWLAMKPLEAENSSVLLPAASHTELEAAVVALPIEESPAPSHTGDSTPVSSRVSLKSPSPANSDSTGITVPPPIAMEPTKTEPASLSGTTAVEP